MALCSSEACSSIDGYGTGMRALISTTDGASWAFDRDIIVIKAQRDDFDLFVHSCECGFGNTIELDDRTLVTVYSYGKQTAVRFCFSQQSYS